MIFNGQYGHYSGVAGIFATSQLQWPPGLLLVSVWMFSLCLCGIPLDYPKNMVVGGLAMLNFPLGVNACMQGALQKTNVLMCSSVPSVPCVPRLWIHHDLDQDKVDTEDK